VIAPTRLGADESTTTVTDDLNLEDEMSKRRDDQDYEDRHDTPTSAARSESGNGHPADDPDRVRDGDDLSAVAEKLGLDSTGGGLARLLLTDPGRRLALGLVLRELAGGQGCPPGSELVKVADDFLSGDPDRVLRAVGALAVAVATSPYATATGEFILRGLVVSTQWAWSQVADRDLPF
jgi:hypothetical protein